MFGEGFMYLTLEGLIGFAITAVGIWLIVKQLREAKLASQMEGALSLQDRYIEITEDINILAQITGDERWQNLKGEEARKKLFDDEKVRDSMHKVGKFYELLSVLVQTGAQDKTIAKKLYGGMVILRWKLVEEAMYAEREKWGVPGWGAEWEWLAKEFE